LHQEVGRPVLYAGLKKMSIFSSSFSNSADTLIMVISGTSMEDVLASQLTNRSNTAVMSQISQAVMMKQMDQQEAQAAALVKMIQNSSLDGTGRLVNRTV
jgi:hypothetical protein